MKLEGDGFEIDREVSARDGGDAGGGGNEKRQRDKEERAPGSICPSAIPGESTPRSALADRSRPPALVLTAIVKASLKVAAAARETRLASFQGEKPENISSKGGASVLIKLHRWTRLAFLQGTMTTAGEKK